MPVTISDLFVQAWRAIVRRPLPMIVVPTAAAFVVGAVANVYQPTSIRASFAVQGAAVIMYAIIATAVLRCVYRWSQRTAPSMGCRPQAGAVARIALWEVVRSTVSAAAVFAAVVGTIAVTTALMPSQRGAIGVAQSLVLAAVQGTATPEMVEAFVQGFAPLAIAVISVTALVVIGGGAILLRLAFVVPFLAVGGYTLSSALRHSWHITRGHVSWLALYGITMLVLNVVGGMTVVGLLITLPLFVVTYVLLYRAVCRAHDIAPLLRSAHSVQEECHGD